MHLRDKDRDRLAVHTCSIVCADGSSCQSEERIDIRLQFIVVQITYTGNALKCLLPHFHISALRALTYGLHNHIPLIRSTKVFTCEGQGVIQCNYTSQTHLDKAKVRLRSDEVKQKTRQEKNKGTKKSRRRKKCGIDMVCVGGGEEGNN